MDETQDQSVARPASPGKHDGHRRPVRGKMWELEGRWLMGRTRELWPLIGRMIVGVLIVRLCTVIPEIGGWIKLGVVLWGIGAIAMALYRRFQQNGSLIAPMSATPAPVGAPVGGL